MNSNNSINPNNIYNIPNQQYYLVISVFFIIMALAYSMILCIGKLLHSNAHINIVVPNVHLADSGYGNSVNNSMSSSSSDNEDVEYVNDNLPNMTYQDTNRSINSVSSSSTEDFASLRYSSESEEESDQYEGGSKDNSSQCIVVEKSGKEPIKLQGVGIKHIGSNIAETILYG